MKLRSLANLPGSTSVNTAIDGILSNPAIRQALFDKLAKSSF